MQTTSDTNQPKAPEAVKKMVEPKSTRHWRAWFFQGYLLAATIGFGVLFALAGGFAYLPIDLTITRAFQTINLPWFGQLMWLVSYIGYPPQALWSTVALIILIFVLGFRWEAVMAAFAGAGAQGVVSLVKIIVHRPRPTADLVLIAQQLNGFSFPSGHTLTYMAFFGFLVFLAYTVMKPSFLRGFIMVFFGLLIVLVGPSRIYLGGHWASDVLGAYLLGSLWLTVTVWVYRWGKTRFFVHQPAAPEKPQPATENPPAHS
jgi:membrane-associated phospholipid phosphatase